MTLEERIEAFLRLGDHIQNLPADRVSELAQKAQVGNQWFMYESVSNALKGIGQMLEREQVDKWISGYSSLDVKTPKVIGLIMAGNIPLVGFHDLMCVLIAGHVAAVKTSSQDEFLMKELVGWLVSIEPRFKERIEVRERLINVDALIATGSDNTARYLEYYFREHPKIIRKNRTSVAVLDGSETSADYTALADDIFLYFGLGCRNVSKLFTPVNFDHITFFEAIEFMNDIANHNKYRNNYDYNKSILLVNGVKHLDNGFLLLQPSENLVSPISVLFHETYDSRDELNQILQQHEEKIQCKVGNGFVPFGEAQSPKVWDYADSVDTLDFLVTL